MTQVPAAVRLKRRGTLEGRTLYVPGAGTNTCAVLAAAYRAMGVDALPVPLPDAGTLELARQYTNGDECYPELVTLGSVLRITEQPDFDPARTAIFFATASGPCRFGQYGILLNEILVQKGIEEVLVISPTSANGYEDIGANAAEFIRLGWWAIVCADGLSKLLLQTRPYETNEGDADRAHDECLELLCAAIGRRDVDMKARFAGLVDTMVEVERRFCQVPARYTRDRPLIGVVGEIYCRLDSFTNAGLIRRIERLGGEAWLAGMSEWVLFTNFMEQLNRRAQGQGLSKATLKGLIRNRVQQRDEHRLLAPLREHFVGYEEAPSTRALVEPAIPYLPYWGAQGEMVLSVGGAIYLQGKGADGVVDISPFSCMNGIICEAIYPKVSRDLDNLPIRIFYFDGTEGDYDRDVEIFLELAHTYRRRKRPTRVHPPRFAS
ncbi:MAG: hypothetical protein ABIL09_05165 [Gemmatimonadota bacterium]